jgi:DNA invertase Pin-like site-specific DNA recombinase
MSTNSSPVRETNTGPVRAVGYCRVSTDTQAERGYGLAVQQDVLERFCRASSVSLVQTFTDPGVPGTTPLAARRGLTAALDTVKSGEADVLVVARFDRLARDALEALLIEREFRAAGGGVLYASGANGDDDGMRLMRHVMHALSEFERRQLVARLASARKAKAAAGGYAGGRPPFGYEARGGQLHPKPQEVEVVRWIFAQVLNGRSLRKIAAALARQRTLGRRWRQSDIGRIVGRTEYKCGPTGARIVDPKTFNRAQAALMSRRKS